MRKIPNFCGGWLLVLFHFTSETISNWTISLILVHFVVKLHHGKQRRNSKSLIVSHIADNPFDHLIIVVFRFCSHEDSDGHRGNCHRTTITVEMWQALSFCSPPSRSHSICWQMILTICILNTHRDTIFSISYGMHAKSSGGDEEFLSWDAIRFTVRWLRASLSRCNTSSSAVDEERLFGDVIRVHCSVTTSVSLEMHHSHYCQVSEKYQFVHPEFISLDGPASTNHIYHRTTIGLSDCYQQTIQYSSNLSVVDSPVVIACAADEQLITNCNDFLYMFLMRSFRRNIFGTSRLTHRVDGERPSLSI